MVSFTNSGAASAKRWRGPRLVSKKRNILSRSALRFLDLTSAVAEVFFSRLPEVSYVLLILLLILVSLVLVHRNCWVGSRVRSIRR
jgi:hypothetical protein